MDKIEPNPKLIVPIVVGVILFVTDFTFGWLSLITGPVPMLFVIAIIIGILSPDIENTVWATIIAWITSVLVSSLVAITVLGYVPSSNVPVFGAMMYVIVHSPHVSIEILYGADLNHAPFVHWMLAPMFYVFSFGFSALGGLLGKYLRKGIQKKSEVQIAVVEETPIAQETTE
ncbi:MAG: hypothetical protein RTV31_10000 [Candidatus Thorarchaeota archaeon]